MTVYLSDHDEVDLVEELESRGYTSFHVDDIDKNDILNLIDCVDLTNPSIGSELYFTRDKLLRLLE